MTRLATEHFRARVLYRAWERTDGMPLALAKLSLTPSRCGFNHPTLQCKQSVGLDGALWEAVSPRGRQ